MFGRLEKTVLDCPDPRALAAFYGEILGMRVNEDTDGNWVVIGREPGMRELAFQKADPYVPPRWPDPGHPQQEHLDIRVDDVDAAQQEVLRQGATLLDGGKGTGFRVFADPVGHPFCLVYQGLADREGGAGGSPSQSVLRTWRRSAPHRGRLHFPLPH